MRYVDLSATVEPDPPELPEILRTEIEYADHARGAADIEGLLGVGRELLRDGEGWAVETFTRLGTHNTTHVDAPWHYNSRVEGTRAATIDELPLDWFHGPGVVLDATAKDDGEALTVADVESELRRIGHEPAPGDVVLVHTGRDAFYGQPDYIARGPGVSAEATVWLCDRGVRLMGIDAWGWDAEGGGAPRGLLGRPPVRSRLLPDRAAGQPRRAAAARLRGCCVPAQDRARQRRAGAGRGDGAGLRARAGRARPRSGKGPGFGLRVRSSAALVGS